MGNQIIRTNAIKLLWVKAKEIGLNSDQIHDILQCWVEAGFIKYPRISMLENKELAQFMNKVLDTNVFIQDDNTTKYLRYLINKSELSKSKAQGILNHYKIESIYQLKPNQKRFLIGYLQKNQ
jgi:hypothetical protein